MRERFILFNDKPIEGYRYKGKRAVTLIDLDNYVEDRTYMGIYKAHKRAIDYFNLIFGIEFDEVPIERFSKLESRFKKQDKVIILYREALLSTLSCMNSDFARRLHIFLIRYFFDQEDKKQFYFNYEPQDLYLLPQMGNKHYSKNMDLVDSRGEQIIANILYELGVPYQIGVYFSEYGFNSDFVIKTEPQTIIEYWGMVTDDYLITRKWKEEKYKELGWNLISIEPNEVENIPKLRKRLMKLLVR